MGRKTTTQSINESTHFQPSIGQVLQFRPRVVDVLLFLAYRGTLTVSTCSQRIGCLVDVVNVLLVGSDLAQELLELLLQNLSHDDKCQLSQTTATHTRTHTHTHTHARTHTHTHAHAHTRLTALCLGLPR